MWPQVTLDEARKTAVVTMPSGESGRNKSNISRTIGRHGSNVRLASSLTGWAIRVEQPEDFEAVPRLFGGRGRGRDSRGGRGRGSRGGRSGGRGRGGPQMASSSPSRRPWGDAGGERQPAARGHGRSTDRGERPKMLARITPVMNEASETPEEMSQEPEVSEEKLGQLADLAASYSGGVVSTPADDFDDVAASAPAESEPDDPVPTIPGWQGE